MPILKQIVAPNGASVYFHKITNILVSGDGGRNAIVSSWATEADYLAGKGSLWNWENTCEPLRQLVLDTQELLAANGDFSGGSVMEDGAETIAGTKSRRWAAIKTERARRLAGTFTHAGSTYDIDPTHLAGASIDAREALIADEVGWTQAWVLSDNTTVTLTAAEMIAVGRACKAVVSDLWATSQYLRGLIDAATTVEEVDAVVWPS